MAYYGRLNWIEPKCKFYYGETISPSTGWGTSTVAYSSSNKADGAFHSYSTTVVQGGSTYMETPTIKKYVDRKYSAKKTISGKARQYFITKTYYLFYGFLTALNPESFTTISDRYQNVMFCKGYDHSSIQGGLGEMPAPTSVDFNWADIDIETVDGKKQIATISRNTSGYAVRDRIRRNVVTMTVAWGHLTEEEHAQIMSHITKTEYVRVCYRDPITGEDKTTVMYINSKSSTAMVFNSYRDLTVEFVEV